MVDTAPRLLVAAARSPTFESTCARLLPEITVEYASTESEGPWSGVEALVIGTPSRDLPRFRIDATPRLRFVQRLFTGLDGFPFEMFPEPVAIAGNGGAYAPYVAEHAIALALGSSHHLREGHDQVASGRIRPPIANQYLAGEVALILGFGEIGRAVALRLAALGMEVEALTRDGAPDPAVRRSYPAPALRDAVRTARLIVDCRPLTRSTVDTIDRSVLEAMRGDAILVNVGRARTIVEKDLLEHLKKHPDFRAALDVFWHEQFQTGELPEGPQFTRLPNFRGTPHTAAIGTAARSRAERMAIENVARFFSGAPPRFVALRGDYLFE